LKASLDEPTETVVMHRTEPTKLQTLALQLSEKVTILMDHTERIMQVKGGEMGPMLSKNQRNSDQNVVFSFSVAVSCIYFEEQQSQQNQQSGNWNKQSNWNKNNKQSTINQRSLMLNF
jgi:translation initiation factor 3 subunit C